MARGLDGRDDTQEVLAYLKQFNRPEGTWATWLLKHHARQITVEELLQKARSMGTQHERIGQECEAYFTIAMRALIDGDQRTARKYFEKTMASNITIYIEHYWARDELKRLDEK